MEVIPKVLMIALHSTDGILQQYQLFSTVLKNHFCTNSLLIGGKIRTGLETFDILKNLFIQIKVQLDFEFDF